MMLYLIRGIPGSGKSTLAKQMVAQFTADAERRQELVVVSHLEADQYFMRRVKGRYEYMFDATKLKHAHEHCRTQTERALAIKNQRNIVIVSNTFTTLKEMEPYFAIASNLGVPVNVILCQGQFGSVHNVPEETIERMKARFQYDVEPLYKKYDRFATHGHKEYLDKLVNDDEWGVRRQVAIHGHKDHLDKLVSDGHWSVREQVAIRGYKEHLDKLVSDGNTIVRKQVAKHGHKEHLDKLVNDDDPYVRGEVVIHGHKEHLDKLVNDGHPFVRAEIARQAT